MKSTVIKAMIIGHAIGDALGVPAEFKTREELAQKTVFEMTGYGTHKQPPGTWSDDTSMTICLLESMARRKCIDYKDIMDNFLCWMKYAEFTATDITFDVGIASQAAIHRYEQGTPPLSCGGIREYDNGNGSLMRIAPLALFLAKQQITDTDGQGLPDVDTDTGRTAPASTEEILQEAHRLSSLTHRHPRSQMACGIYTLIAIELLKGQTLPIAIESGIAMAHDFYVRKSAFKDEIHTYNRLWNFTSFKRLPKEAVKSSGYVVDTLEAALWCLLNTSDYRNAVLTAVNLGEDTDTVGAIVGGLAGAAYGWDGIPKEWKDALIKLDFLEAICQKMIQ